MPNPDIWNNPRLLRLYRDLCPKNGEGISGITFESGGKKVTLTTETRARINRRLRQLKEG